MPENPKNISRRLPPLPYAGGSQILSGYLTKENTANWGLYIRFIYIADKQKGLKGNVCIDMLKCLNRHFDKFGFMGELSQI